MIVPAYTGAAAYSSSGVIGAAGAGGGCARGPQIYQDEVVIPQIKSFTQSVFVSGDKLHVEGYM